MFFISRTDSLNVLYGKLCNIGIVIDKSNMTDNLKNELFKDRGSYVNNMYSHLDTNDYELLKKNILKIVSIKKDFTSRKDQNILRKAYLMQIAIAIYTTDIFPMKFGLSFLKSFNLHLMANEGLDLFQCVAYLKPVLSKKININIMSGYSKHTRRNLSIREKESILESLDSLIPLEDFNKHENTLIEFKAHMRNTF